MSKMSRLDSLDLLRGLAALLVLAGHLRSYIFLDLAQAGVESGIPVKVFYFVTGLGHQSVIIFFGLSGFLVGGKALDNILRNRFSWPRYLLRRLTRLWIVIIPTLLLTLLLDRIGLELTHGIGYDGRYYDLYSSGPHNAAGVDHSLVAAIGNLVFLQTISVPRFGSNIPIWSLANEFWYYVVFPLAAWIGLARVPAVGRALGLAILLTLVMMLPGWILAYGAIWVAGAAAAWCSSRPALSGFFRAVSVRISAAALLFVAMVAKSPSFGPGDLAFGIAVALTLPVIAHLPNLNGKWAGVARASSEVSYTLYLTHFPLLTLIVLAGFAPVRWPPNLLAAGIYTGLMSAAIVWAIAIWWCFERNTDRVYSLLISKLASMEVASLKS
jgi:peptidoglycan/LPS O-acetylase OafA/YrhL